MEDRKIIFWDIEDEETLLYGDKNEAIEMIIDSYTEVPETFELCGFARKKIENSPRRAEDLLEDLLECFDENHGGEEPSDATKEMIEATEEYLKKMVSLYTPWQCDIVKRENIDVKKWVKENAPEWLPNIKWVKEGLQ